MVIVTKFNREKKSPWYAVDIVCRFNDALEEAYLAREPGLIINTCKSNIR